MADHIQERIEMMRLLAKLQKGSEKPGHTVLRALRLLAEKEPTK